MVSVGIPVYNGRQYIVKTIQSVLNQTYSDFELIVTDDGSIDNTIELISQVKDQRIKVVADGENRGLPYRLNQQIAMAQGEYFIRMDADDIMFPDRLAKQVNFLKSHPEVDVVGAKSVIFDADDQILYQSHRGGSAPRCKKDVLNGNIFIHPTVAGKAEWFRNHPYDETKRRSQDFFLWLSSVENSTFALIDDPLIFYRVLKEDTMRKFVKDNQLMKDFFWSEFRTKHSFPSFANWLNHCMRFPIFCAYHAIVGDEGVIKRRYCSVSDDEMKRYEECLRLAIA